MIRELHEVNYFAYGSRRMWKALRRAGERVGRSRVERLMSQEAIQGAKRRGKPWRTTTPDPGARRQPDLVGRDFAATRPDELWFADFTYLRCWDGLVFFAFVIDAYSRRVIGWQFASPMRTDPDARRSRRARIDRHGRRRLRQRGGRELRRQLQDRADPRPRLAHQDTARARDRRIRRLVQPPAPALSPQRQPASRTRIPLRGYGETGFEPATARPPAC